MRSPDHAETTPAETTPPPGPPEQSSPSALREPPDHDSTQNTEEQRLELQQEMERVLESALNDPVISRSPHQSTGNAYQTIRLGDGVRGGFRAGRLNLLAGFELADRLVCDLGSNLGEISRDLHRAGASHVDAYEYDYFFTQLARYITAYNGLPDINHLQADVSLEGFMRRQYDVCVGLAAYSYMQRNIDYICRQVSDLLIVETHEVRNESWHRRYVQRIIPHFAHWCCFGKITHGRGDTQKRRLWLAFSNTDFTTFYRRRAATLLSDEEGVVQIDLSRSPLNFFEGAGFTADPHADPVSPANVRAYRDTLDEYERQFAAGDHVALHMSSEAYWLALLCGIAEFERARELEDGNVYLRWMKRALEAGAVDPGLRYLLDDRDSLHRKVSLRLSALGGALRERDISHFGGVPVAYNPTPSHPDLARLNFKTLAVSESDERLCVPMLDGHHRLFVMKLLCIDSCPLMTVWDPDTLHRPKSLGRVENYEKRMYQYLGGVEVDDPIVSPPRRPDTP